MIRTALYGILFVFCIILFSCDGKDKIHHSNKERVTQSHLSHSFFKQDVYIPMAYREVIIDTLLGNGFQIKATFYSDMEHDVLQQTRQDTIDYNIHYRDHKIKLRIEKDGEQILNKLITKQSVSTMLSLEPNTLDNYVLNDFWIEELDSLLHNNAILYFKFCKPASKTCEIINLNVFPNKAFYINNRKQYTM